MMKGKLTLHFFISLCLAMMTILLFSFGFVQIRSNIFQKNSDQYNYGDHYINQFVTNFEQYISKNEQNKFEVSTEGLNALDKLQVKLQILNASNDELYEYNRPTNALMHYSNSDLINLYHHNEESTMYLKETTIANENITYLLFFPIQTVKRHLFTFNMEELYMTHNLPILLFINLLAILLISFLYSIYLSKPLNHIISSIVTLSKGDYHVQSPQKGLYGAVIKSINELSLKLSQNEIERQNLDLQREEWISNISHDIKTPLTSILGSAEIMADTNYKVDDSTRHKYSSIIINKAHYIKSLVDDLNLSTRLRHQQFTLNTSTINLVSLLRHVVIQFLNDPKYETYDIQFKASDEQLLILGDEQLLKRVFINLMTNAIVHNNETISIDLTISSDEHNVKISIIDDGVGVASSELEHIFNRYYRGTNTSIATEGSGLGMAIAHDIITVHGGSITAKSELNQGMNIEINLPIKKL